MQVFCGLMAPFQFNKLSAEEVDEMFTSNNWGGKRIAGAGKPVHLDPKRRHAYHMIRSAIRSGTLVRPTTCEEQDGTCSGPIQAAHYAYNKPLLIRWLCASHHKRWDMSRKLKEGEEYAF